VGMSGGLRDAGRRASLGPEVRCNRLRHVSLSKQG
jgi:hypothetical protein